MSETRTIYVYNTKTQKKYTVNTNAATLGELKHVLKQNNIEYNNLSFTEGISHTTLLNDSDNLPSNIPFKGNVTNNLVLLLTNTVKNISSGMDRKEAYESIKANNLEEAVKQTFGKNFTQVKTSDLEELINNMTETNPNITGTVVQEEDIDLKELQQFDDSTPKFEIPNISLSEEERENLLKIRQVLTQMETVVEDLLQLVDTLLDD